MYDEINDLEGSVNFIMSFKHVVTCMMGIFLVFFFLLYFKDILAVNTIGLES